MGKRSIFFRVFAAVLLVVLLPMLMGAQQAPTCVSGECGETCPGSDGDCTDWWISQTWENFWLYSYCLLMGLSPLVCCPD